MSNVISIRSGLGAAADAAQQTVRTLTLAQKRLMDLGFKLKFGADGKYGAETKRAIQTFQNAVGLTADGGLGAETLKWLATVSASDVAAAAKAFNDGQTPESTPKAVVAPPSRLANVKAALFPPMEPFYLQPGWYILGGLALVVTITTFGSEK